jgi:hypothetical protein
MIGSIIWQSAKTGYTLLAEFEEHGVLRQMSRGARNRVFEFTEYMALLRQ